MSLFSYFIDDFYLCELLQHVYANTKIFRIMWLTREDGLKDCYYEDYIDHSEVLYLN